MYEVVTIIQPIDYTASIYHAIDRFNGEQHTELNELDSSILIALRRENKGMRNATLMKAVRNRIFADRFTRSLDRLLSLNYIVRTEYRKFVYYTITLKGRKVLEELNIHLIAIISGK